MIYFTCWVLMISIMHSLHSTLLREDANGRKREAAI